MKRLPDPPPTVVLMLEPIDIPGAPADPLPVPQKIGPAPWVLSGDIPKVGLPSFKLEQAAKPGGEFPGRRYLGFFPPRFIAAIDVEVVIIGPFRARMDLGDPKRDDGLPDIITGIPATD